MKATLTALTIFVGLLGVPTAVQANCSGTWSGSSYSGSCRDNQGGNYRVNGYSGGYGGARINGYTGGGSHVQGTIQNDTFRGYVGDDYVTCNRTGCY